MRYLVLVIIIFIILYSETYKDKSCRPTGELLVLKIHQLSELLQVVLFSKITHKRTVHCKVLHQGVHNMGGYGMYMVYMFIFIFAVYLLRYTLNLFWALFFTFLLFIVHCFFVLIIVFINVLQNLINKCTVTNIFR